MKYTNYTVTVSSLNVMVCTPKNQYKVLTVWARSTTKVTLKFEEGSYIRVWSVSKWITQTCWTNQVNTITIVYFTTVQRTSLHIQCPLMLSKHVLLSIVQDTINFQFQPVLHTSCKAVNFKFRARQCLSATWVWLWNSAHHAVTVTLSWQLWVTLQLKNSDFNMLWEFLGGSIEWI